MTSSCLIFQAWAATDSGSTLTPLYDYQDDGQATPVPVKPAAKPAASHSALPFLGDEARKRGYDLPEPFGVNINYMNIRQNINVDSINFNGLSLGGHSLDNAFKIKVGNTRESSKTETLKLDAWLLPFMNIYGLVGYTDGHSISQIGVGVKGARKYHYPANLQNLDFKLDFKGTTYGIGTTLVGGVGNWFTAVDANYTQTQFDILDGSIDAFTVSPRVGYRFATPGVDTLHLPSGKLNVWVGSMYQDVQQEFKGSLNDLSMPSATLQRMVDLANKDGNGRFDVKQHLQSPWNVLVGAQYELTRNFNITSEIGFAERNSFFVAGEYRF
ncbi:hypothetical protein QZP89_14190 [Citrobacter werkmanii]|uniref:Lipoprotein n=2 Tax=Enterobacteriaceae TaxID=543 RepID=A0AA38DT45_9ENTR|nr:MULTISPECIES: hypothetical protein [Citrobacter]MDN8552957.1 hypothetical protein [Citrobacter werkmanii]MDT0640503.1 hypothetical protein [Citrobacter werkmanii]MEC3947297.1 hypothetical protein [Citrobacter werkmanii]HAT7593983.1 hypothetical protein [Citrobacter werkmanii]HCL5537270.1 hypothetical protein [Citrobacter werkmanii]